MSSMLQSRNGILVELGDTGDEFLLLSKYGDDDDPSSSAWQDPLCVGLPTTFSNDLNECFSNEGTPIIRRVSWIGPTQYFVQSIRRGSPVEQQQQSDEEVKPIIDTWWGKGLEAAGEAIEGQRNEHDNFSISLGHLCGKESYVMLFDSETNEAPRYHNVHKHLEDRLKEQQQHSGLDRWDSIYLFGDGGYVAQNGRGDVEWGIPDTAPLQDEEAQIRHFLYEGLQAELIAAEQRVVDVAVAENGAWIVVYQDGSYEASEVRPVSKELREALDSDLAKRASEEEARRLEAAVLQRYRGMNGTGDQDEPPIVEDRPEEPQEPTSMPADGWEDFDRPLADANVLNSSEDEVVLFDTPSSPVTDPIDENKVVEEGGNQEVVHPSSNHVESDDDSVETVMHVEGRREEKEDEPVGRVNERLEVDIEEPRQSPALASTSDGRNQKPTNEIDQASTNGDEPMVANVPPVVDNDAALSEEESEDETELPSDASFGLERNTEQPNGTFPVGNNSSFSATSDVLSPNTGMSDDVSLPRRGTVDDNDSTQLDELSNASPFAPYDEIGRNWVGARDVETVEDQAHEQNNADEAGQQDPIAGVDPAQEEIEEEPLEDEGGEAAVYQGNRENVEIERDVDEPVGNFQQDQVDAVDEAEENETVEEVRVADELNGVGHGADELEAAGPVQRVPVNRAGEDWQTDLLISIYVSAIQLQDAIDNMGQEAVGPFLRNPFAVLLHAMWMSLLYGAYVLTRLVHEGLARRLAPHENGALTCVVCREGTPQYVFRPCQHLCCCSRCANDNRLGMRCPICRQRVNEMQRIFLP